MSQHESLVRLLREQYWLQRESFNVDFKSMTLDQRREYVRWNVLALTDELHEMMQETGWKPWASSEQFNGSKALDELVDAFHFMMNLMLVTCPDLTPAEIAADFAERYDRKRTINAERQTGGYDGVSTKCPKCRRALDDPGALIADEELRWYQCAGCGNSIDGKLLDAVLSSGYYGQSRNG